MVTFKIRPSSSMLLELTPKAFKVEQTVNHVNTRKEHDDNRDVA